MRACLSTCICGGIFGLSILIAPACGDPVLSASQLKGANIHTNLVSELQAKQGSGPEGPVTIEFDWNVSFLSGEKISWTYRPTIRARGANQRGNASGSTSGLGETWQTTDGDAMWQFSDGDLTFVRSYRGGAMRIIMTIRRDGANLTCDAVSEFARDVEQHDLIIDSPIDGTPFTISSWKLVSSHCEVTSPSVDPSTDRSHAHQTPSFDGIWQASVVCEKEGAIPGWSHQFIGRVRNNVFHGDLGQEGKPGWFTYDGTIERDGNAKLIQKGLVGDSSNALGHARPGTSFAWPFAGRFQQSRGTALRVAGRTCHMDLVKIDLVKQ
jgi:hypothetical protein